MFREQEWLKEVLVKFNGYRAWVLKELGHTFWKTSPGHQT